MARVNIDSLRISELKWTGMGEFNSDDHYIYYREQEFLRRNGVALIVNKRVWKAVLGCNLKNDKMISVRFQGKPFNITVIQVYAQTSNAEEAESEWFYEDLQDLLLRVPWTARRSNQSILKESSPECSLEGIMLNLKLQYFGHLMWRVDSLEKTLMLGGIGGRRRRGRQRMRWLDGIRLDGCEFEWTPGVPPGCEFECSPGGQGGLACCNSWGGKDLDTTEQLKWTELNKTF